MAAAPRLVGFRPGTGDRSDQVEDEEANGEGRHQPLLDVDDVGPIRAIIDTDQPHLGRRRPEVGLGLGDGRTNPEPEREVNPALGPHGEGRGHGPTDDDGGADPAREAVNPEYISAA